MVMRKWFLLPARAVMAALFVAPMAIVAAYSLLTRGAYGGQGAPWTLENYARLLDPLYAGIAVKSFWIAGVSTAVCLAMGFPLALFIARARSRNALWRGLVTLPFWTSFLVRSFYNDGAVVLGLVYGYLPYMVLPVYAVLEKMDGALLEAAGDLGARPWEVVLRVVLPLAKPGLAAGGVLVFIPCLGAYLTPDLMGGGKCILIVNVCQNQFSKARDWPFGAALSVVLMAMVMALAWMARRRGGEGGLP